MDIDRIYRNCQLCLKRNVYSIEDEYHFLMVCPYYEDIRYKYFPDSMLENVSLNKFYNFLKSKNDMIITSLAKYLYYAFKQRKILLDE